MKTVTLLCLVVIANLGATSALAGGSGNHSHGHEATPTKMLETMRDQHADHDHAHDFAAMDDISEDDMHRTIDLLIDIGLVVPTMDSQRGKVAFIEKGCILCHAVNEVGGDVGPSFNASDMVQPMNAFEFAARMWRGAPAMAQMQEDLLGEMIALDGQELADIVAFVHDTDEQKTVSADDIPAEFRELLE